MHAVISHFDETTQMKNDVPVMHSGQSSGLLDPPRSVLSYVLVVEQLSRIC